MRDPNRIDVITELINKIWHQYPDLRFWQVINMLRFPKSLVGRDLFYVEDDQWEKIFKDTLEFIESNKSSYKEEKI